MTNDQVSGITRLMFMQRPFLLLLFAGFLNSTGFSQSPVPVLTKEDAIKAAAAYLKKTLPETNVSQKPPAAEFFANAAMFRGVIWAVGFAYPAPKDPVTGKTIGVRPFISLDVWVRPDGSIETCMSHTP